MDEDLGLSEAPSVSPPSKSCMFTLPEEELALGVRMILPVLDEDGDGDGDGAVAIAIVSAGRTPGDVTSLDPTTHTNTLILISIEKAATADASYRGLALNRLTVLSTFLLNSHNKRMELALE